MEKNLLNSDKLWKKRHAVQNQIKALVVNDEAVKE